MSLSELYESTKINFAEFQAQGKKYYYPVRLKEAALKLLAHYPLQKLARALSVTDKTLRNWQKATRQAKLTKPVEFVSLNVAESIQPEVQMLPTPLTLKLPHGLSLILPEQAVHHTAQLVRALVKEFDQCSI